MHINKNQNYEKNELVRNKTAWWLTQNSQVGFGRSDRHGEQRAGVHAFVRQCDIIDADGQLRPRGVNQLDPVVP